MQLILDAEDIDFKSNMSTIEHESLNEKFLANKITDRIADDICSGNKENIQKQNNVISEQVEDVLDNDKVDALKNNELLSNNLNGENAEPDVEIDNAENLEKEDKLHSNKIDSELKCNQVDNVVNDEALKDSELEQPDENSVQSLEEENKLNLANIEKDASDSMPTTIKNADNAVILDDNNEDDKCVTTKESNPTLLDDTTEENDSSVELENDDPIILDYNAPNTETLVLQEADNVISVDVKENGSNHEGNETNKIVSVNNTTDHENLKLEDDNNFVTLNKDASDNKSTTLKETCSNLNVDDDASDEHSLEEEKTNNIERTEPNKEKGIEVNEVADKTVGNDLEQTSSPNKIDNKSCNKEEMDNLVAKNFTSGTSTTNANANESNPPIEIDDEDVKTNEDISESSIKVQELDVEMQVTDEKVIPEKRTDVASETTSEPKRICKLSNNLDIFSDEEEEENPPKSPEVQVLKSITPPPTEKVNTSVEDDDVVMVIDEDTNVKDSAPKDDSQNSSDEIGPAQITTTANDDANTEILQDSKAISENATDETVTPGHQKTIKENIEKPDTETDKSVDKVEETQKKPIKPLLPKNFVKSCKKNLADMTRDELEEFCILKIVESIVDRSSLGEIKSQLKNLTQTMEECKKKCLMLTKQNKDLQVVLKSVQEEQKIASDVHIAPLKITRSVGMQVVMMVEKSNMRKKPANGVGTPSISGPNTGINKTGKTPPSANTKTDRKPTNPQIPVPRLVPAVPAAKTNQTSAINNSPKQVNNNSVPNGLRVVPPAAKVAEKRSRSQSITVDLTDDEPPVKQQTVQRNFGNQGVRMGGPQQANLITAQRFAQNVNSPRKVYIPISGQAQNVRPGQTIMLKPVQGLHPRQRCPPPHTKVPQAAGPARIGRTPARHPAPLPEAPKQYQPPNWKTLPPAPDLKLSKVENGIVISWKIDNYQEENHEIIASYQLYAYQETQSPPSTSLWKKIGDVKALPLPMACTLTQFMAGYKYYFAVRAVDVRSRFGPFSLPGSILLLNKM